MNKLVYLELFFLTIISQHSTKMLLLVNFEKCDKLMELYINIGRVVKKSSIVADF